MPLKSRRGRADPSNMGWRAFNFEKVLQDTLFRADGRTRRIFARCDQGDLTCSLGPILDLSKGGARVQSKQKAFLGSKPIEIHSRLGVIVVEATVVWSQKLGFRNYMHGIQFIGVPPRVSSQLQQIMDAHSPKLADAV